MNLVLRFWIPSADKGRHGFSGHLGRLPALYPQGVRPIRKAAEPPTAGLSSLPGWRPPRTITPPALILATGRRVAFYLLRVLYTAPAKPSIKKRKNAQQKMEFFPSPGWRLWQKTDAGWGARRGKGGQNPGNRPVFFTKKDLTGYIKKGIIQTVTFCYYFRRN